jgi:hypothetical protein
LVIALTRGTRGQLVLALRGTGASQGRPRCSCSDADWARRARQLWLAHADLDRAVWAARGWPEDPAETDDETILASLLAVNLERPVAATTSIAAE